MSNATMNRGRLAESIERRNEMRIEIDSHVKHLIFHFDPMDRDLEYVERIDTVRVETLSRLIRMKKRQLEKVIVEIARLKEELGRDE